MKIIRFKISEGFNNCEDVFSQSSNLLFSHENAKGKTTYLRLLFYALGYNIPETQGIVFSKINCYIEIENKGILYKVARSKGALNVLVNDESIIYTLPTEHTQFLMLLFDVENIKLLNNILGIIYVDQDKGWTLLNRGLVIGSIRFNIEEFVAGLSDINIDSLLEKKKKYEFEIKKLKSLIEMNDVQNEMLKIEDKKIITDDYVKKVNLKISYQKGKIAEIKRKLKEATNVLNENISLFSFLEKMKIYVKSNSGENILVNRNTIANAEENIKYIEYQKTHYLYMLEQEKKVLTQLSNELNEYYEKSNNLFGYSLSQSDEMRIYNALSQIQIDLISVNNLLAEYSESLKNVKNQIINRLKANTEFMNRVYNYVYRYCDKLGIGDKISKKSEFIFTDKLKRYSGTILHKLVISFKIAMHKILEEKFGYDIPFILDSPTGREVKKETVKEIMNLIFEELPNTQLIIASIYDYFNTQKTFIFENYAIEKHETI